MACATHLCSILTSQASTLWVTGMWMQQRQQKIANSKQTDVMDTPFREASKTRAGHTGENNDPNWGPIIPDETLFCQTSLAGACSAPDK